jgi:hypothetical protein
LLQQNESFSHSWFINFDSHFQRRFIAWFLQWWSTHGAIEEIMPEELLNEDKKTPYFHK